MQKQDRIQRRNIDPFREAARIAQDAADLPIRVRLQPVEALAALPGVVGAVHMPDFAM